MKYFVYLLPLDSISVPMEHAVFGAVCFNHRRLGKNRKATTSLLLDQISGLAMYTYIYIYIDYINSHSSCDFLFTTLKPEHPRPFPASCGFCCISLSGETDLQKSASAPGLSALQFKCLGSYRWRAPSRSFYKWGYYGAPINGLKKWDSWSFYPTY